MNERQHASTVVEPSRRSVRVLALLVLGLHALLTVSFLAPSAVFSTAPITGDDFDTHIAQSYRVLEGLEEAGRSWVYDVKLLAGQPEGTIFDADHKGWTAFTYLLTQLGVDKGLAFNLFVLCVFIACPLVVYGTARLLGATSLAAVVAAGLASLLWFFDSFVHWVWWIGMVSYGAAGFLTLVPFALFFRFTEERRLGFALGCAVSLALVHLVHPYSFFILAPGFLAMYLRAFRAFGRREHLAVSGIVATTLLVNAFWLRDALSHWHYVLDSAYYGHTGLDYLLADYFSLVVGPTDTGVLGSRTGFRLLAVALAVCGLLTWRARGDRRALPLGVTLGALFLFAYFGAYLPHGSQVQPYRHVLPLGFFSTIAAGAFVQSLYADGAWRAASRPMRAVFVVALLSAGQHLGRDVIYFLPELVPEVTPLIDGSPPPMSAYGYGRVAPAHAHPSYRVPRGAYYDIGVERVVEWVKQHVKPGERVLADYGVLGERLAWATDAEVLGGFRERNIAHAYANFFRRYGDKQVDRKTAEYYLRTFAVRYVILYALRPDLEQMPDLLEPIASLGGPRIYRVKLDVSPILTGGGELRARTNRIAVRGSDPSRDLVLSYHYHEALRCTPDCKVERLPIALDEVGFIRVPAPHAADLVIWNGY